MFVEKVDLPLLLVLSSAHKPVGQRRLLMNSGCARFKKNESFAWLGRFRGKCWVVRHLHALPQTLTFPLELLQDLPKTGGLVGKALHILSDHQNI